MSHGISGPDPVSKKRSRIMKSLEHPFLLVSLMLGRLTTLLSAGALLVLALPLVPFLSISFARS